jgi:hypothetical protein
MKQEMISIQFEVKLKNSSNIIEDHEIIGCRNVDIILSDDIARIREEASSLHQQFDVMKHSVHCVKYELNDLKLISDIALQDHEILERRQVGIVSPYEVKRIP